MARLAWCDKIPLAILIVVTLVLLFLGMGHNPDASQFCRDMKIEHPNWTSADSYCFVTDEQHWIAFLSIEWTIFLKIIGPIWIALRLLDAVSGGIANRRRTRELARDVIPPGDFDLPRSQWTASEPDWRRRLRRLG